MINEEAIFYMTLYKRRLEASVSSDMDEDIKAFDTAIKALEQQSCEDWYDVPSDEMTLEQARQAVKELRKKLAEYLEQKPCDDCISRQAVLEVIDAKAWEFCDYLISESRNEEQKPVSHFADNLRECISEDLPSVTPQQKTGRWIEGYEWVCSNCGTLNRALYKCCSHCGKMEVEE